MQTKFKAMPAQTQLKTLVALHFVVTYHSVTDFDFNESDFDENEEAQRIFSNTTGQAISDFMCTQGKEFDIESICELLTDYFEEGSESDDYSEACEYNNNARFCAQVVDYLQGECETYPN